MRTGNRVSSLRMNAGIKRLGMGVIFFLIVIAGWPRGMASLYRNIGMHNLAQDALTISPVARANAADWLAMAENAQPNSMTLARLGSTQSVTQSHTNMASSLCGDAEDDFLRTISQPLHPSPATPRPLFLLTLETLQSAQVKRSYFNNGSGCETKLAVDFEQSPNRYATLSSLISVRTNTRYRISGFLKKTGSITAWFGIRRLWPGHAILLDSNVWEEIRVEFVSSSDQPVEIVQLLITSGDGDFHVRDLVIAQISS